ncbi:ADP-ribose glycohydrolase MACROD2 isoform X1 [Bubalus kerabau]|uniref:ADP-ribose glycohydrolase MACROD2 isoform X1 n=1 Tax=Bubalus carabanensis TaxID=3119969 RepID=UPI00244EC8EA|nr:ADP-ribose glycohydrolase MACROD2 isoform X1 [Bubalus carabanensis]
MYPSNKKKKVWREEKERLLKMTIEERRKEYIRDYVPLNTIPSWKEEMKGKSQNDERSRQKRSIQQCKEEKAECYLNSVLENNTLTRTGHGEPGSDQNISGPLFSEL